MKTDKNGLVLSNQSDSGYKFVTTLFKGPLAGKYIAFADVTGNERQYQNSLHGKRVDGFFGYKNVVALGAYDDVRDAAYVGQHFYGDSSSTRNANLDALFEGDESVIPVCQQKWNHDPDFVQMEKAKVRAAGRVNIDVQQALSNFYKENSSTYKVSAKNAQAIRDSMNAYLGTIEKIKNSDMMEAARLAFEPFKK